jgi:hypothetical protein
MRELRADHPVETRRKLAGVDVYSGRRNWLDEMNKPMPAISAPFDRF